MKEHGHLLREQIAKQEEFIKKAKKEIGRLIDSLSAEELMEKVLLGATKHLDQPLTQSFLDDQQRAEILHSFQVINYSQKEGLCDAVIAAFTPLIELRAKHALAYEDADAEMRMQNKDITPVNERIYFTINGNRLHLHLLASHERKNQVEDLYKDALHKIVPFVKAHPEIEVIGGWSWLNATKTYGAMKERLGFTISDILPEELEGYEHSDNRPRKNALISREEFLQLYEN